MGTSSDGNEEVAICEGPGTMHGNCLWVDLEEKAVSCIPSIGTCTDVLPLSICLRERKGSIACDGKVLHGLGRFFPVL